MLKTFPKKAGKKKKTIKRKKGIRFNNGLNEIKHTPIDIERLEKKCNNILDGQDAYLKQFEEMETNG